MPELLTVLDLPAGFDYPRSFIRVVERGIVDLEPWHVMVGEELRQRLAGLAERYPDRSLIPFARRQDNDDVACWDVSKSRTVVHIVHDFASPGWESRETYEDFSYWLRQAVEDLIEWDTFE